MSIVDDLRSRADLLREDVARLREAADELEKDAAAKREKAARIELNAVETVVAANFIESAGLTVTRTEDGLPFVKVDRILSDPPSSMKQARTQ